MYKPVTVQHNGVVLHNFHLRGLVACSVVDLHNKLRFRATEVYDFEYGIGGSPLDEYYRIKSIKLADNDTRYRVKVSKVRG